MSLLLGLMIALPALGGDEARAQGMAAQVQSVQAAGDAGKMRVAEKQGDFARERGNSKSALTAYSNALKDAAPAGEDDWRLRGKIIALVGAMGTPPPVPEVARKHMLAGVALDQDASDKLGHARAAIELEEAVNAAPWWLTAYYQLALVYEKAGRTNLSYRALKLYLSGSPNDETAKKARDRLYSLEQRGAGVSRKSAGGKSQVQWVTVPGGDFWMGSGNADEQPQRKVSVPSFQMSRTLVTNKQYRLCMRAGACAAPEPYTNAFNGDDQPVVGVDWNQAKGFAEWAGARLPSEAEWEYAARSAGEDWRYPWGKQDADCSLAVVDGCGTATAPVCSKPGGNTKQGLCDMAGNVWEWTQDWYHGSYDNAPPDGRAWENPPGLARVVRGGAWDLPGAVARAASRGYDEPTSRHNYLGFRVVRSGW